MKLKLADYSTLTEAELAADEFFQQWVLFPEENNTDFWKNFLSVYPHQQSKLLAARQLLESLEKGLQNEKESFLSIEERTQLKQDIFQALQLPLEDTPPAIKKWPFARIAAVIFAVIAIPVYFLIKQPKGPDLLVEKTGTKETREIVLPDSSVVILNGNSVLKYPAAFLKTSSRAVYLEGNAYFKVKKMMDKKPFEVHAQSVSITVLGTQFNVNARSKTTEIVLTSGRVKVQADGMRKVDFMEPGEKLTFDTLTHSFIKTLEDKEFYSAWYENRWNFKETSLGKIAELITEYYGVDVLFKNTEMKQLKMSALLPVESLQKLQNIIAATLEIQITETNNQIIIH